MRRESQYSLYVAKGKGSVFLGGGSGGRVLIGVLSVDERVVDGVLDVSAGGNSCQKYIPVTWYQLLIMRYNWHLVTINT